ncbi:Glutathione transport system permease protein GsiD [bacterium HR27]|nr:Glutathione transport system permease protein GsiD [bacterium HR27]
MAVVQTAQPAHVRRISIARRTFARFTPLTLLSIGGLLLLVLAGLLADVLAPYSPEAMHYDALLQPPSSRFWFGTDDLGRDIFSRILFGLRNSIVIATAGLVLGTVLGAALGLISAYAGGFVDFVLQRFAEALIALPVLVIAIVMVAILGPSRFNVALAIAIALLSPYIRVVRAVALRILGLPYCEAARALGAGHLRILFRHVLPNCWSPIVALASVNFGVAILAEAGLSFLGLGLPPPAPSLGGMLTGSVQRYFYQAPWMAIFPGLVITAIVLCANLVGDALRDFLDPRSRWRI